MNGRFGRVRSAPLRPNAAASLAALGLVVALLTATAAGSAAGERDRGFGVDGSVVTDLQSGSRDRCRELLVQPDKKLVCVGTSTPRNSEFSDVAIARYFANGQLDQSFGSHGIALFDSGLSMSDVASSAVLQPDGKIVIGGAADVAGADGQDFLVARFNPDGSVDTSFDGDGFVLTDLSTNAPDLDWALAVALQRDGKLVVAGETDEAGSSGAGDVAMVRYTPTGELDPGFGNGGKVVTDLAGPVDAANALEVFADGRILVGSASSNETRSGAAFVLARYLANGTLDPSFGAGGVARADIGIRIGGVQALLRQTDGRVLAAGWAGVDEEHAALARFGANGQIDRTFGRNGSAVLKLTPGFPEVGAYAAALQSDGKIVLAGGNGGRFLVARYLKTGKLDPDFGGLGFVTAAAGRKKHSYASAVRIQADGRIVAAGAAGRSLRDEDFALIRFRATGASATRLAFFSAATTRRGVIVRWRTQREIGSRRFLLYRQQSGRRVLIGRFAARGGPRRGAVYTRIDRPGYCCDGYWLVELKRNGRRVDYGPVAR